MKHGRRLRLFFVLLLGALVVSSLGPSVTRAADAPPVFAFYYPWYEQSDWTYTRMHDIPTPRYSGADEATLKRHIQQADDAGINVLVCTWLGPSEPRTNSRCKRMLKLIEQSKRPIRLAIIPDQSVAFDPSMRTVEGLGAALDTMRREFTSSPYYYRFQGKPAVFWFYPPSLGDVSVWRQLRDRADPSRDQYWFGGTDVFGFLDVFDALYYYDITWESRPGAAMASYAGRLQRYNKSANANRPFIATVMPGYDDLRVRNGHQRDRQGGAYYRETWKNAIDWRPAAIVLTSFNEFLEGTAIEPSEQYGDLYLRLTREGVDALKAAAAAPPPAPTDPPKTNVPCRSFPETGRQVCGRLLEYWQQNGGLPVFGFPISDQFAQTIEGRSYQVQWFERNRLELHPENERPYDVLLGRLGVDTLANRKIDWRTYPRASKSTPYYFAETGHAIGAQFYYYWSSHGLEFDGKPGFSFAESLALFGQPVSGVVTEVNPTDGKTYLTQHFERARFEYHPELAGTQYEVLLGLLGRELTGIR